MIIASDFDMSCFDMTGFREHIENEKPIVTMLRLMNVR